MKTTILLKKLSGMNTIESAADALNASKRKAIYYIHRLRKKGYVRTRRLSNNRRIYTIYPENRLGLKSYEEMLNELSPVKIASSARTLAHGDVKAEELLVYALEKQDLRYALSALALFRRITDWTLLYKLAKKSSMKRKICALYDLSKSMMRVRKMTNRFRNNSLPKERHKFEYIIQGLRSDDFKKIELKWKVYLPFNSADLEEYG